MLHVEDSMRGNWWRMLIEVALCAAIAPLPGAAEPPAGPTPKKPVPLVTISKETTYITEPLRPDGYPDYVAFFNARCSQGVTPENNAAVLLFQAVGPHDIQAEDREEFFKWLGVPIPTDEKGKFIELDKFFESWKAARPELKKLEQADRPGDQKAKWAARRILRENGFRLTDEQFESFVSQEKSLSDLLDDQHETAIKRPWSESDYPILAAWLDANEDALALMAEASRRSTLFTPMIQRGDDTSAAMIALPALGDVRAACMSNLARATLRTRSGSFDAARDDLSECHRWARLIGHGPTLIHGLIALAIERRVCDAIQGIAAYGNLSKEQLVILQTDFERLPLLPPIADSIDVGERCFGLDATCRMARSGPREVIASLAGREDTAVVQNSVLTFIIRAAVNWDRVLRRMNRTYDRLVEASQLPSLKDREAVLGEFEAELRKFEQSWKPIGALRCVFNSRAGRSDQMANICSLMLLQSVSMIVTAHDRVLISEQLTRLTLALAGYRADHGKYPATLAELVPEYVKEVPKDGFSEQDLFYKSSDEGGYLLYSVGPNGKDDGGRDYESEPDADPRPDDIVVRAPGRTGN